MILDALGDSVAVSIHAPAKGATGEPCNVYYDSRVSIHAPAKGATGYIKERTISPHSFNPRSREGSDLFYRVLPLAQSVSIHAPAKGAT